MVNGNTEYDIAPSAYKSVMGTQADSFRRQAVAQRQLAFRHLHTAQLYDAVAQRSGAPVDPHAIELLENAASCLDMATRCDSAADKYDNLTR